MLNFSVRVVKSINMLLVVYEVEIKFIYIKPILI